MTNSGTSPLGGAGGDSHLYPTSGGAATPALAAFLRRKIEAEGAIPFPEFMNAALYHQEWGYYARGIGQTGKHGDFFTSVSVGPVFGRLLARRFLRWWRESGKPLRWRVLEVGAHDGSLARDVLEELAALDEEAFGSVEYVIVEPLPRLMAAQHETLRDQHHKVVFTEKISGRERLPGVVFGNEVLDALPFEVMEYRGEWRRGWVSWDENGEFVWKFLPWEGEAPLPAGDFEKGYRTEVRTNFAEFLSPFLKILERGLLLFLDYGFAAEDYYHPGRSNGTLRTFSRHEAGEDPLKEPGERDITAHVDFTAFTHAAASLDLHPTEPVRQGTWLTKEAREWLLAQEGRPDAAALRQFQTLTHPAQLGGKFMAIELGWNESRAD